MHKPINFALVYF